MQTAVCNVRSRATRTVRSLQDQDLSRHTVIGVVIVVEVAIVLCGASTCIVSSSSGSSSGSRSK